jgi:hypothetical protein
MQNQGSDRVYPDIWVESDMMGDHHIMVKRSVKQESFNYCTFHHIKGVMEEDKVRLSAERTAIALGAKKPVLIKPLELDVITAFRKQHAMQQQ